MNYTVSLNHRIASVKPRMYHNAALELNKYNPQFKSPESEIFLPAEVFFDGEAEINGVMFRIRAHEFVQPDSSKNAENMTFFSDVPDAYQALRESSLSDYLIFEEVDK
jgi:hypothetical protein